MTLMYTVIGRDPTKGAPENVLLVIVVFSERQVTIATKDILTQFPSAVIEVSPVHDDNDTEACSK